MYGYVRVDKDSLSAENTQLYYAHFCGLCKTAGKRHGQFSRFLVSFDLAFMDIFMRAAVGETAEIREEKCIADIRKTRKIACGNDLTKLISDTSVLLGHMKLTDDIIDGGGFKRRFMRWSIRRAYNKAKRAHRPLETQIKALYSALRLFEDDGGQNIDAASHYFAQMLSAAATYISERQKTKMFSAEETKLISELFYNLGKWVYIMDAADDLEEDKKANNFNPLKDRENLDEVKFILGCCSAKIAECYEGLALSAGREIIDNIIYKGLYKRTEKILAKGGIK